MSMVSRLFMLLLVGAALAVVQPNCAYACSCLAPGTPAEELQQSDAVFLGTVVDVKTGSEATAGSGAGTTVTFEVAQVWKGQITQTFTLTTPDSSASCGITFEPGQQYVVYGRANEGVVSANLCSRTNLAGDATEDLAALGAGQPPEASAVLPAQLPATGATEPIGLPSSAPFLLVFFGVLAIVIGVLFVARNRHASLRGTR